MNSSVVVTACQIRNLIMNLTISLNEIYDDTYGNAVDVYGHYYWDTNGHPLSVHDLEQPSYNSAESYQNKHRLLTTEAAPRNGDVAVLF